MSHYRRSARRNTGIIFVPTMEAYVVERFGKFNRILDAGINFAIPFIDKIAYANLLKEQAEIIGDQQAITSDNVVLEINGVLYIKVEDPHKASYVIADPQTAITKLAQTTMRAVIGSMTMDQVFREREALNAKIVESINNASFEPWGIKCLRYEISDVKPPSSIAKAMEKEVEAEKTNEINKADGLKRAKILQSEAEMLEQINLAEGAKTATLKKAEAEAKAIHILAEAEAARILKVGEALETKQGNNAASLTVAEKYIEAYGKLAQESTTLILPKDSDNVAGSVATALSTFNKIGMKNVE